jgi:transcriptional regulator of nitric oxide reductase
MTENERGPKLWEEFLKDGSIRKFRWKTGALRAAVAEAIREARVQKSLSGR